MEQIIFYILAFMAVASGGYVVFSQHLIRSVFMLFVTLLSVAGLYVFALADFVALTQVVIYVGGVLVLLLFVFMLSNRNALEDFSGIKKEVLSAHRFPGMIVFVVLLSIIIYGILQIDFTQLHWIKEAQIHNNVKTVADSNITNIGVNLMSNYLLPFELISILLMMVLIGAANLARKEQNQ